MITKKMIFSCFVMLTLLSGTFSCGPYPRDIPAKDPKPELSFGLQLGDLGFLLGDEQYKLRIDIFKVKDGNRQGPEGTPIEYDIDPSQETQEIRIPSLTLGTKDFVAQIVSASLLTVGEGEFRYTIKPGEQTMTDGLTIRMIEGFGRPTTDEINLTVKGSYQNPNLVTYQDIKPYLRRKCVKCHNPLKTKGDVNLLTYPFSYPDDFDDLEDFIYQVIDTMSATDDSQMPPEGNRPTEPEIALFESWIDGGLLESGTEVIEITDVEISWRYVGQDTWKPFATMTGRQGTGFQNNIDNLIIGKSMDLKFKVLGNGSIELATKEFPTIGIRKAAILNYEIDFQMEKPTNVKIPVKIEIPQ